MNSLDEKIIEKYLSGECSEAEMAQIVEWMKASEDNRKEWLKLRMVPVKSNLIHFSGAEHLTRSYQELRKVRNDRERLEREITRRVIWKVMRYAASILLLIGLSFVSYRYVTPREHPKMAVVAVSGNEAVRKIVLDDSTCVYLSAGSRIEYPERFAKNERKVSVEGKVYFEVATDLKCPFYVKTDSYTVKVLGTSFEVNAYKFAQISDVTLVEGKVEIFDRDMASMCTLQPGQLFEIDKLSNQFTLQQVNADMYASWHEGKLEFDGLTFAEIVKILERHYNVRFFMDEGIAKDIRLVGSLKFQKDIHQMMRAIELVVPISYQVQTNPVVYIQPKN